MCLRNLWLIDLGNSEALWISALQVSFRWSCSWGMLACNRDSQRSPVPNLRDTSYSRCPLISTKGQAALLGSIPGSVLFHLSLNHSYTATCCLQLDGRYQLVGIQHLLVNPSGGDPDKNWFTIWGTSRTNCKISQQKTHIARWRKEGHS